MFEETIARAARVVGPANVVAVVAAQHARWWQTRSRGGEVRLVVQPRNRGTAAGILLPLLDVLARDPGATLLILPSDHHVRDEEQLCRSLREAVEYSREVGSGLTLLGIQPEGPETEYGWIEPGPRRGQLLGVRGFVEKPDPHRARSLYAAGALWNSFMMVAQGTYLKRLIEERLPGVAARFEHARRGGLRADPAAVDELYAALPEVDFSRDVLQGAEGLLHLLCIPACGWSDLGTPARVARCLEELPEERSVSAHAGGGALRLDRSLARLRPGWTQEQAHSTI